MVKQYAATRKNWTIVKLAGLSKALRIDLEEVFVNAEDMYHVTQRACETRSG